MSIYLPAELSQAEAYDLANELIDSVEDIANRAPEKFAIATSPAEVRHNHERDIISLPLGMENGEAISGDLDKLAHFHERGIRYITLAHSKSNHISDSSYDPERQWQGLSEFGRSLVPAMNAIGMMIDVSHISDEAFWQVIESSNAPVIASHSSARHFTPGFERNMSDDMIKALAKNGGVIQINFGSTFLSAEANDWYSEMAARRDAFMQQQGVERDDPLTIGFEAGYRAAHPFPYADVDVVLDHIDHVVGLVGVDHVGIGSDYDGVGDSLPEGLKSVADYPNLVAGLMQRGYSETDIRKILGGNLLRVWAEVEARAAHSQ